MVKQRYEFVVQVEGTGSVIQCLHNNPNRRYFRRVSPTPVQGVHQEKSPEPLAAAGSANGQPAQEGGRNQRVPRKSFADDVRESVEPDTISGKGVVAENGPVDINQDEWRGDFPPCILAGLVVKVFIEFQNARTKGGPVVRGAERLYPILRFKWHASPQGNLLAVLPGGAPQDCRVSWQRNSRALDWELDAGSPPGKFRESPPTS